MAQLRDAAFAAAVPGVGASRGGGSHLSAHALSTPDASTTPTPTPTSVKVMRNIDVPVLLLALVLFVVAGWPIAGWIAGAGAWAVQRGINELAVRRAEASDDPRTR